MFSTKNPKNGNTLFLHVSKGMKSGTPIYYFSKQIVDSVDIPDGWELLYSRAGHPYIRKGIKNDQAQDVNSGGLTV